MSTPGAPAAFPDLSRLTKVRLWPDKPDVRLLPADDFPNQADSPSAPDWVDFFSGLDTTASKAQLSPLLSDFPQLLKPNPRTLCLCHALIVVVVAIVVAVIVLVVVVVVVVFVAVVIVFIPLCWAAETPLCPPCFGGLSVSNIGTATACLCLDCILYLGKMQGGCILD